MQSRFRLEGEYLVEKMGPVKLWMKLRVQNTVLEYELVRASIWGVTLPARLAPQLRAFEKEEAGTYVFEVRIDLPILGKLIEYGGQLQLLISSK
jgi:hypothetical protein